VLASPRRFALVGRSCQSHNNKEINGSFVVGNNDCQLSLATVRRSRVLRKRITLQDGQSGFFI
jgi:hypothetical protein